jgi:hypothetical protein
MERPRPRSGWSTPPCPSETSPDRSTGDPSAFGKNGRLPIMEGNGDRPLLVRAPHLGARIGEGIERIGGWMGECSRSVYRGSVLLRTEHDV